MTSLSDTPAEASTIHTDVPTASSQPPHSSVAPSSLPAQIIERFVARLAGPDGVSPETAAALGALLAERALPSREVMLRTVQEAVETAHHATIVEMPEPGSVKEDT